MQIRVLLTNCMEHSCLLQANSSSGSQEIPCIMWKPEVHCHVHRSLLFESLLYHMILSLPRHPVTLRSIVFFYHLCSSLQSAPWQKNPVCISLLSWMCHVCHSSHLPWFDQRVIWRGAQIIKLLYVQFSPPFC